VCVCVCVGPRSKLCLCVSEGVVINDPQALFLLLPSSAAMSHTPSHVNLMDTGRQWRELPIASDSHAH